MDISVHTENNFIIQKLGTKKLTLVSCKYYIIMEVHMQNNEGKTEFILMHPGESCNSEKGATDRMIGPISKKKHLCI